MFWKFAAVAIGGMIIGGILSLLGWLLLMQSYQESDDRVFIARWSSEGKNWEEFSSYIAAGGRSYQNHRAVANNLEVGTDEDEIRRVIGPPDWVFVGEDEIASAFKFGANAVTIVPGDRRRPLDYIPYLAKSTAGMYIYKIGRLAFDPSHIELFVLTVEFSATGKLTRVFSFPISSSNPVGDYSKDTRTDRRVGSR